MDLHWLLEARRKISAESSGSTIGPVLYVCERGQMLLGDPGRPRLHSGKAHVPACGTRRRNGGEKGAASFQEGHGARALRQEHSHVDANADCSKGSRGAFFFKVERRLGAGLALARALGKIFAASLAGTLTRTWPQRFEMAAASLYWRLSLCFFFCLKKRKKRRAPAARRSDAKTATRLGLWACELFRTGSSLLATVIGGKKISAQDFFLGSGRLAASATRRSALQRPGPALDQQSGDGSQGSSTGLFAF